MADEPSVSKGMKGDLCRRGEAQVLIQLWDSAQCEKSKRSMR